MGLESQLGTSEISAKTVRLFVPFWLRNESQMQLSCRLVEIEKTAPAAATHAPWLSLSSSSLTPPPPSPSSSAAGRAAGRFPSSAACRVIRSLESLEDAPLQQAVMLSLDKVEGAGLSVALAPGGQFSSAIPLKAFEDKVGGLRQTAPRCCFAYHEFSPP